MSFKRGDVVRIIRVDPGDDPAWKGFLAEVADTYIGETSARLVDGGESTNLVPLADRPDARFPYIDPRGQFFWPSRDLELADDGSKKVINEIE